MKKRGNYGERKTLVPYIMGTVDQELLVSNEYLVADNHILRNQIAGRVCLTDRARLTLTEIGKRLGEKRPWQTAYQ